MTIKKRQEMGMPGNYPMEGQGLIVWDDNLDTLQEALNQIDSSSAICLASSTIAKAINRWPEIITRALQDNSELELIVDEPRGDKPENIALNAGGYALQNKNFVRLQRWYTIPNTDRGSH